MMRLKGWPMLICGIIVFFIGYNEVKKGRRSPNAVNEQAQQGDIKAILIDTTKASLIEIAQDVVEAIREGKESQREVREQVAGFTALVRAPGISKRVSMCANNSLVSFIFRNSEAETLDYRNNMLLSSFKANKFLYALLQTSTVGLGKKGTVNIMFSNVADFQPFLIGRAKPIINGPAMVELTVQQINGHVAFEPGQIEFISGENKNSITGARNLEILCGQTVTVHYTVSDEKTDAILAESAIKFRLGEKNDNLSLILEYLVIKSNSKFEVRLPKNLAESFVKGVKTPVVLKGIVVKSDE